MVPEQVNGRTALILAQSGWAAQVVIDAGVDVNVVTTVRSHASAASCVSSGGAASPGLAAVAAVSREQKGDGHTPANSSALTVSVSDKDWTRALTIVRAGGDLEHATEVSRCDLPPSNC